MADPVSARDTAPLLQPAKIHALKTWPEFFRAVVDGRKRVEIRLNDRDYHVGDCLVLQEYEPDSQTYTGEMCSMRVTHMTSAWMRPNYVALSIEPWEAALVHGRGVPPPTFPIPLTEAQEQAAKDWAADDRLWTTQDTVEINLRTFARVILMHADGAGWIGAPPPLPEWQPIETAPKDGTRIIGALIRDGRVWRVHDMKHNGLAFYTLNGGSLPRMTHWMPLPAAPAG